MLMDADMDIRNTYSLHKMSKQVLILKIMNYADQYLKKKILKYLDSYNLGLLRWKQQHTYLTNDGDENKKLLS